MYDKNTHLSEVLAFISSSQTLSSQELLLTLQLLFSLDHTDLIASDKMEENHVKFTSVMDDSMP